MKTYILDIIPRLQRFSKKLENSVSIANKHWVLLNEGETSKVVYIFREKDNQLLISNDGKIERGTWEYLGNNSLLIDKSDGSFLFRHGFIDENVLALRLDGKEEYAILVNEQLFIDYVNSVTAVLSFLEKQYINNNVVRSTASKQKQQVEPPVEIEKPVKVEAVEVPKTKKKFNSSEYPELEVSIKAIKDLLTGTNKTYAADIIIGFSRSHSLETTLIEKNREVAELTIKGRLPLKRIEDLFHDNNDNHEFVSDLEAYLRLKLEGNS